MAVTIFVSDCPSLQEQLVHRTFLEEMVFWTVRFEFPQRVVCLLLNMLPDNDYKVSTSYDNYWQNVTKAAVTPFLPKRHIHKQNL
jgi:hypothetical protein